MRRDAIASKVEYKVLHGVRTVDLDNVLNTNTEWWRKEAEDAAETPWKVHQCTRMDDDSWTVVFERHLYKYREDE